MFRMKDTTLDGDAKQKLTKHWGTYAVLVVSLGAMTFFGICTPTDPRGAGLSGNVATVDGEKISSYDFRRAYQQQYEQMRQQYGADFKPAQLGVSKSVVEELVNSRVLYLEAKRLGLQATDDEVVAMLTEQQAFKDENGKYSEENFKNYLRYTSHTEESFLQEMKRNLAVQKLRNFITTTSFTSSKAIEIDYKLSETKLDIEFLKLTDLTKNIEVTPEEVTAFLAKEENKKKVKASYDSNKADYSKPEQVKASHILVSFKGARNAAGTGAERSKEDAKARAESLLALAKAGDFTEIAMKETDEPAGKETGGDLGFFSRESMVKEFSDAAFALNAGDLSGVVESPFGFHIIKVFEKNAKADTTLEQAQPEIARKMVQEQKAPVVIKERSTEILTAIKSGNAEETLKKYNLAWKATGSFSVESRSIPEIGPSPELAAKISKLTTAGQLLEDVVDVSGTKYIVRLLNKTQADLAKLDNDKKEDMTRSASFMQGYYSFGNFEKEARKRFDDKKSIKLNDTFVNFDQIQQQQQQQNQG